MERVPAIGSPGWSCTSRDKGQLNKCLTLLSRFPCYRSGFPPVCLAASIRIAHRQGFDLVPEGLSVKPTSGRELKSANGVLGVLASPRSTVVFACLPGCSRKGAAMVWGPVTWPRDADYVFGQAWWTMRHGVSARRSSSLQLKWLNRIWTSPRGAGGKKLHRMPMRRERSARMMRGSNTKVQWPGAAPGRATWCEANN